MFDVAGDSVDEPLLLNERDDLRLDFFPAQTLGCAPPVPSIKAEIFPVFLDHLDWGKTSPAFIASLYSYSVFQSTWTRGYKFSSHSISSNSINIEFPLLYLCITRHNRARHLIAILKNYLCFYPT